MDGHTFGKIYAIETQAGIVDSRIDGNVDLDQPEHEYTPTNLTRPPT